MALQSVFAYGLPYMTGKTRKASSSQTEAICCFFQNEEDANYAPTVATATKPFADLDLFVANEAYSTQQVGLGLVQGVPFAGIL